MLRGGSSGKPGHSQVDTSPEEMHRAHLAYEASAEFLEDAIGLHERMPEEGSRIRIVARMLLIFLEWYCHFHLDRAGKDPDLDTEFGERLHGLAVEVGDRHGF